MRHGARNSASGSARASSLVASAVVACVLGFCLVALLSSSSATARRPPERHPQTSWASCNLNSGNRRPSTFRPLPDAKAASLVTREPEDRSYNARPYTVDGHRYPAANDYVPTAREIRRFHRAKDSAGQTMIRFNPYFRFVDGRDGLRHPSTDDLIQWAAHKWGIPEDWLRAEYVVESYWNAFQLGDQASVGARWYRLYPPQARVPHSTNVYQSLGITQVKWIPDGSVGAGSEPLRWKSTAFNIDYQAATARFYYDDPVGTRSTWGDRSYRPCESWNSIGGWYQPYPWGNHGQQAYVAEVTQALGKRSWASSGFVRWHPSSFPPGVRFR